MRRVGAENAQGGRNGAMENIEERQQGRIKTTVDGNP